MLREQQHEEALALNEDDNKAVLQELLSEAARLHPYAVAAYTVLTPHRILLRLAFIFEHNFSIYVIFLARA